MSSMEIEEVEAISPDKIFISNQVITEKDALDAVRVVLKSGNLEQADQTIDTLLGLQHISGKALAMLLHGLKVNWNIENGHFNDYMESRHGLKPITVDRYILVWEKISAKQIPASFQSRPLRDQIPVAKALEQGYEIKKSDWERLTLASSNAEVLEILRGIKGKKPRKSSLRIYLERDGTLNLWKNDKKKFVGYLDTKSEDEDVQKAIARIVANTGVMKK